MLIMKILNNKIKYVLGFLSIACVGLIGASIIKAKFAKVHKQTSVNFNIGERSGIKNYSFVLNDDINSKKLIPSGLTPNDNESTNIVLGEFEYDSFNDESKYTLSLDSITSNGIDIYDESLGYYPFHIYIKSYDKDKFESYEDAYDSDEYDDSYTSFNEKGIYILDNESTFYFNENYAYQFSISMMNENNSNIELSTLNLNFSIDYVK